MKQKPHFRIVCLKQDNKSIAKGAYPPPLSSMVVTVRGQETTTNNSVLVPNLVHLSARLQGDD